MNFDQEQKIVSLASEISKAIVPIDELLRQLNITEEEWQFISKQKAFKDLVNSSSAEWGAAANTHKRAKLKASAVIETVLPTFYNDMVNLNNKLSDRAKVLETVAKIAGLGTADPIAAPSGNTFKLQIVYSDGNPSVTLSTTPVIEGSYSESNDTTPDIAQIFKDDPLEEL